MSASRKFHCQTCAVCASFISHQTQQKFPAKHAQRGRTISRNDGKDGRDGTGEERGAHGAGIGISNAEDKRVKNTVEVTHHSHGRRKDCSAASHSPNSMYYEVLETFHPCLSSQLLLNFSTAALQRNGGLAQEHPCLSSQLGRAKECSLLD